MASTIFIVWWLVTFAGCFLLIGLSTWAMSIEKLILVMIGWLNWEGMLKIMLQFGLLFLLGWPRSCWVILWGSPSLGLSFSLDLDLSFQLCGAKKKILFLSPIGTSSLSFIAFFNHVYYEYCHVILVGTVVKLKSCFL